MKDSYSFDVSDAALDVSFQLHHKAYCNTFSRCGLNYIAVEASSGAMGGSQSREFMVRTDAGDRSSCRFDYIHYTVFSLVNDARIGLVVLPQEETKASEVNDLVTSQRVIGK